MFLEIFLYLEYYLQRKSLPQIYCFIGLKESLILVQPPVDS